MPTSNCGIDTYYDPVQVRQFLMFAPGGFERRSTSGAWPAHGTGIDAIKAFAADHTIIVYDRVSCGDPVAASSV